MNKPRCSATNRQGQPCGAFAMPERRWCWTHNPDNAEARREACARGGRSATKLRGLRGRRARLDTPRGLLGFVATVVHDAVEGKLAPDIARAALYGISIQRQLLEAAVLEQRIVALELSILNGRGTTSWRR